MPPTQSFPGKETSSRAEDGAGERTQHSREGGNGEHMAFPHQVGAP